MPLEEHLSAKLASLEANGLLRQFRQVSGPQTPRFILDGRSVLSLCSNNYLGLANDPRLREALISGVEASGLGSGASRLISGSMDAHAALEARLASYVRADAALLFSTGYAANVGTVQAVVDGDDIVFSDALNHASLIDGCRLSRAKVRVYEHANLDQLDQLLRKHRHEGKNALVISDALFSMDGDFAQARALRHLCDTYDAALMIDEAHSLGIWGPRGRGLCASLEVRPDLLIGTLGKAFGCAGAFVAASATTVRWIANRARSYVFSTAPSPAIAHALLRATDLVEASDERRVQLHRHAERLRQGLTALGYRLVPGHSPILPILVGQPQLTMQASARLLELGVFVHGIRPPTVPPGTSRLRLTPMATHTDHDIDLALAAFQTLATELPALTAAT